MEKYLIFADVSLDMPVELAKKYDIHFVPMRYILAGEEYECAGLETPEFMKSYFDKQRNGAVTQTSQATPGTYMECFRPLLSQGRDILYLSLSSALSRTYESACVVQRELAEECSGKLRVVDTLSATGGMGLLAMLAGENREQGLSLEENADSLERRREMVSHHFMVDDLMYLKRGGRISAATAMVGSVLNIKPMLRVDERGKLETIGKKRGITAACKSLIAHYKATVEDLSGPVFMIHGDCPEQAAMFQEMLLREFPKMDIYLMPLSPLIAAHTGPGLLAIVYFGKR